MSKLSEDLLLRSPVGSDDEAPSDDFSPSDDSYSSNDDDHQDQHVFEPEQNFADDEPLSSISPTTHQATSSQKVRIKTHTETTALPAAVSRPNYPTLVTICAPPLQDGEGRTPIDLVTVLDVSGSMAGRKLDLVKQAMKFVIENLGSSDRLSLVTFSTNATMVFPLKRMTNEGRQDAIRAVEALRDELSTNIAAGLKIGAQILKQRRERNPVASIMLLSDGQDNCSSKDQILNSLPSNEEEIAVHTFGFGRDHDAETMHAISNASKGTFSYIESVGSIQDGFALCLGGLLSVVAQEVNLEVRAPSNGVKITSIPSGSHVNEIRDDQGVVHVGNMYAEEVKQFLVYCTVPPTETALLDVTCTYKDPSSDELVKIEGERVEISRPEFCSPAEMEVSTEVDRERNRVLVFEAIGEAQRLAETGNLEGAREILKQGKETLMASAAAKDGDDLINMFETELNKTLAKMQSTKRYKATGRAFACAAMSAHAQQRGNYVACEASCSMGSCSDEDCGEEADSDDDMAFALFDGGDCQMSSGSYRSAFVTPAMAEMVMKSKEEQEKNANK